MTDNREMIHVYLDDYRTAPRGFTAARTAEECLLLLRECRVGVLSLDYNLGWGAPDGLWVVRTIIQEELYPDLAVYMHSSDYSARARMQQELYACAPAGLIVSNSTMPEQVKALVAKGSDVTSYYNLLNQ